MKPQYLQTFFQTPCKPQPLPLEFIIITACNPEGRNYPQPENDRYDAGLAAHLTQQALSFWRVNGGSKDFSHVEPGYAVETDFKNGLQLGRRFKQEAIFWVRQGKLFLVECATGAETPMGTFESRIID
jgi:Protein of unknown function (DUF3293)